jgi:proline iminopeptidase
MKAIFRLNLFTVLLFTLVCALTHSPLALAHKDNASGYITVTDGKLYYATFGSKGTVPVIVLHGGPGLDSSYLLPQMSQLGDENEVTFYDQRGSGKSLGFALDTKSINMEKFVSDLDAVRAQLGYEKFTVIGHSWGGLLAMNYALKHPEHLNAMILVSSAPSNADGFKIFFAEYAKRMQPLKEKLDQIQASEKFKQGDPSAVKKLFHLVFSEYFYKKSDVNQLTLKFTQDAALSGRAVAEIFGKTYLDKFDLTEALHKLKLPVLIVHGENDIVPLSTAQTTKDTIPGAQIVVIEKCDHFPYIETPKEFFKAVDSFIHTHTES